MEHLKKSLYFNPSSLDKFWQKWSHFILYISLNCIISPWEGNLGSLSHERFAVFITMAEDNCNNIGRHLFVLEDYIFCFCRGLSVIIIAKFAFPVERGLRTNFCCTSIGSSGTHQNPVSKVKWLKFLGKLSFGFHRDQLLEKLSDTRLVLAKNLSIA